MLPPDYLLHISEGAEEIAETLHRDILDRIIERIMLRIGRGDSYILTAQDKWHLQVLQDAGFLMDDIQKEIAQKTNLMYTEIAEAMEDAGVRALAEDNKIYEAAGLNPLPLDQSPALVRLVQRNYEATLGEWTNFTGAFKTAASQAYVSACDRAYNLVMSGTVSYSQAVKEALAELVQTGVTVDYGTRKDTIETATMRAVRTGIGQASAQITDARMEEMDWDIILVSSHMGARVTGKGDYTDHSTWQGKFYSKSGKDKRFPPYEVCGPGKVQGIHGANCRHSHGPGDGEHNPWENYDSEENRKAYEQQQRQRTLENRIRNSKREVATLQTARDNATDNAVKAELDREYQRKAAVLQRQNAEYNQFCKDNNLRKRSERISIAKWDRQQAAQARAAAKRWNDEHSVPPVDTQKATNRINYNPNTIDRQYKETEAMNEYDYFSSDQEKFRIESIKEMAGYDDSDAMKALDALCGTSAEYRGIGTSVPTGWFSGADNQIRLATDGEFFEKAKVIDAYIDSSLKYKGNIYRGLALDDETISMFSVGGTFKENGNLSSWTSDHSVASMFAEGRSEELGKKPVIFRSKDPKHGTPAAHLSIFGSEENEVLVSNMKDSEYIIEAVTEDDGMVIVDMVLKGG